MGPMCLSIVCHRVKVYYTKVLAWAKVAVQACNHEITRYFKAYIIETRSTDGNKLYIK